MAVYEPPKVTELGSVADVTAGAGSGPQFDGLFDLFELFTTGHMSGRAS